MEHTRDYWEAQVRGPGKFEGEPAYVAYYWEAALEGGSDETAYDGETPLDAFRPTPADVAMFPELADVAVIVVWESDQGFVYSRLFAMEQDWTKLRADLYQE